MKPPLFQHLGASLLAAAFAASTASAQNVGIGTSTPKSKLSVNGSTAAGGIAVGDASYTSTTGTVAPLNGAIIQGFTGIGTPSPVDLLHVVDGGIRRSSTDGTAFSIISTDGGIRTFRDGPGKGSASTVNGYVDVMNNLTGGTNYGRMFYYKNPGGPEEGLAFYASTNITPQVFIETVTGEVGIGNVAPTTKLHVTGIATVTGGTFPGNSNCMSIGWNSAGLKPGQGVGEFVNYSGTGGGNAFDFYRVPLTGTPAAGNLIASINAAGAYVQVSDERTKRDIQPLRYGLKEVMALKPKVYDFHAPESITAGEVKLGSSKQHQIGFLAQEVLRVVPEAVEKPENPASGLYTMNYASLAPVVVNAIQELKQQQDARATEQDAKIAALQAENAKLKAANDKLTDMASEMETLKKTVAAMQAKNSRVTVLSQ
jgi:hypothetical protein